MAVICVAMVISAAAAFYGFAYLWGAAFLFASGGFAIALCVCGAPRAPRALRIAAVAAAAGAFLGSLGAFRVEAAAAQGMKIHEGARSLIFAGSYDADTASEDMYRALSGDQKEEVSSGTEAGKTRAKYMAGYAFTSPSSAALFVALVTGRQEYLSLMLSDIVRRSGISHVLALSGFHLQVLLVLLAAFKGLASRPVFYGLSCLLVWVYCLWIGFIPSLHRSAFMYTIAAAAAVFVGAGGFSAVWALSGLVMAALTPRAFFMPGFVLSMLALYGVVRMGAWYEKSFSAYAALVMRMLRAGESPKKFKKDEFQKRGHPAARAESFARKVASKCTAKLLVFCRASLCAGLGATVATTWYSMAVFGAAYPVGIAVSLLLTPASVVFMLLGLLLLALIFLMQQAAGSGLGLGLNFLAEALFAISRVVGSLMSAGMEAMEVLLSRAAAVASIRGWGGLALFYAIVIAVCFPLIRDAAVKFLGRRRSPKNLGSSSNPPSNLKNDEAVFKTCGADAVRPKRHIP